MFPTNPLVSKLVYQLAPAALVSAVGIALLSSLAKPGFAPPQATPAATAVKTEAVFTPTPRPAEPVQTAEQLPTTAAFRPAIKPKPQPRKLAATESAAPLQSEVVPTPLPIAPPVTAQPPAPTNDDRTIMARLRGVTATVTGIPQRAYSQVTGWFTYDAPPRPPADVPTQNLTKVSM